MVKATAARGYGAVKVKDVAGLAGVSTRSFYELFDGKEDCFLRTHELLVRRAARGIIVSQAGEHGWRERLGLAFDAFARALANEADAVCLATVDAYQAGPVALEQARRAQSTIEAMIAEAFVRAPDGILVPPLVVEGMVAAVARVVRARFLAGQERELPGLVDELREWATCYPDKQAAGLAELDSWSAPMRSVFDGSPVSVGALDNDRTVILAAVAKLAAADGYDNLTIPRIRKGAGISRRIFDTHFDSVEDCFIAVLEQRGSEAIEQAGRAQIAGRTWAGGIYRAIAVLSDRVASDPILTGACLADDFFVHSRGSRCRKRLLDAVMDQLVESVPAEQRPSNLVSEASAGAVWELFHRHVVRAPRQHRPQVAATLAYLGLAPLIGSSAAMSAIRREQEV
jgi:AcrR family transcriptional regulator